MMMNIIEEELQIIDKLVWQNRRLITQLSQYMDVTAEEKALEEALGAELAEELKETDI